MSTKSKEVKKEAIPVDIAFHISNHLEIPDMENWAEAVGMREHFRRRILQAKQMQRRLESLQFLNSKMMETLAANDFTLTFRTMQRLIQQAGFPSSWYVANLDENRYTSIQKICFEFFLMGEAEKFIEVRSTSEHKFQDFKVGHISN